MSQQYNNHDPDRHNWSSWAHNPAKAAEFRLRNCAYPALAGVACEFEEGVLRLSGTVPTFHLSQIAQTMVAKLDGVVRVCNDLQVEHPRARKTVNELGVQKKSRDGVLTVTLAPHDEAKVRQQLAG